MASGAQAGVIEQLRLRTSADVKAGLDDEQVRYGGLVNIQPQGITDFLARVGAVSQR